MCLIAACFTCSFLPTCFPPPFPSPAPPSVCECSGGRVSALQQRGEPVLYSVSSTASTIPRSRKLSSARLLPHLPVTLQYTVDFSCVHFWMLLFDTVFVSTLCADFTSDHLARPSTPPPSPVCQCYPLNPSNPVRPLYPATC